MLADLFRRSAWLAAGAGLGRLLPLAVLLLASRQLESRAFASASAGFAWSGVAMSLTGAGLATVMTQRLAGCDAQIDRRFIFVRHARPALWLTMALALVVWCLGERVGPLLFGAALDPRVVAPAALAGAMWSQVALAVSALNGCHRARAASMLLATCGAMQGAGMGLGLLAGHEAAHVVWGLAAGCTAAALLSQRLLRLSFDVSSIASLWSRAPSNPVGAVPWARSPVLWNTLAAASVLPASFAAGGLVARAGADGTRELAQYFALEQVHQLLVYGPAIIGTALLPILARHFGAQRDGPQSAALMVRVARLAVLAALLGALVAAAIMIDVGWFVRLLGNPALQLHDAWAVRWMVLNAGLALSLSLLGGALLGAGHIVLASSLNLVFGALFVGLTVAFAARGNEGLQLARLLSSLVLGLVAVIAVWTLARRARSGPAVAINGAATAQEERS